MEPSTKNGDSTVDTTKSKDKKSGKRSVKCTKEAACRMVNNKTYNKGK